MITKFLKNTTKSGLFSKAVENKGLIHTFSIRNIYFDLIRYTCTIIQQNLSKNFDLYDQRMVSISDQIQALFS